jgi:tetratricopeptide (TPR) repeat protein
MQATLQEAEQLLKAGKPREALRVLEPLEAANAAPLRVHMLMAGALMRLGDRKAAVSHLEACIPHLGRVARPVESRLRLATQFARAGAEGRADDLLREAQALEPDNVEVIVKRADLLGNGGRWQEAVPLYEASLTRAPEHPAILASAGIAAHNAGDRRAAIDYYRAALARDGRQFHVYSNLLALLLEEGRAEEAHEHCRCWLEAAPSDTEAMAFRALLDVETGREEDARPWFDYDRVVQAYAVTPPPGYRSLEAFNRALEAAVLAQPDLATPPEDHPTWHHPALRIGPDINAVGGDPVKALEKLMHQAVASYFSRAGEAADHPFLGRKPADYHIRAWSAVLEGEGNQQAHIHMSGYLSGCYYVTIPPEIADPANGADGFVKGGFEMGRPPRELAFTRTFPVRTVKPYEGLMLLFPAYLYHGTLPFKSSERRISIAFDVIAGRPE